MNKDLHQLHQNSLKNPIKSVKIEFVKSSTIIPAMLLDLMLVFASTLLCLVLLLAVTKVDLLGNLRNPDAQGAIYFSTIALLLVVGFIYYTCYRVFLGYTPGEWAYDQKIDTKGVSDSLFTLKVILRSLIIIFSGVIFIPLFSWAMNKDIVGEFLDINLVKRKN